MIRERYRDNVSRASEDLDDLEYHRQRSGLYLFRIYLWTRFMGVVLIVFLILGILVIARV